MRAMPTTQMTIPSLRLHDGIEMPQLGFGVFRIPREETQETVELALEAGYRHLDTAAAYGNEEEVGAALAAVGLPREDYFVTAELWNPQPGHESTLIAFEASLDRLGLDHVDLYMVHRCTPVDGWPLDTWSALEWIHGEEAARTIGVANFGIEDFELLEREIETRPTVNQVELHPQLQQSDLRAWHAEHEVATVAWSPLAQGSMLDDETIARLAESHGKTPAQVILRWHLQIGNVALPKSAVPERIHENLDVFDFELADEDLAAIGGLDRGRRIGVAPAAFSAP